MLLTCKDALSSPILSFFLPQSRLPEYRAPRCFVRVRWCAPTLPQGGISAGAGVSRAHLSITVSLIAFVALPFPPSSLRPTALWRGPRTRENEKKKGCGCAVLSLLSQHKARGEDAAPPSRTHKDARKPRVPKVTREPSRFQCAIFRGLPPFLFMFVFSFPPRTFANFPVVSLLCGPCLDAHILGVYT